MINWTPGIPMIRYRGTGEKGSPEGGQPRRLVTDPKEVCMDILERVKYWLRQLTEVGLMLVALGVVLGILFGEKVTFLGNDVVTNLTGLIGTLGDKGLVGLIALGVLMYLFAKK